MESALESAVRVWDHRNWINWEDCDAHYTPKFLIDELSENALFALKIAWKFPEKIQTEKRLDYSKNKLARVLEREYGWPKQRVTNTFRELRNFLWRI